MLEDITQITKLQSCDKNDIQLITKQVNNYIQAVNYIENNFKKYVVKHVNNRHWLLNKTLIQQDAKKFSFSPEGYDQLTRMRVIGEDFEQRPKPTYNYNQANPNNSYWERNNYNYTPTITQQRYNRKFLFFDQAYHLIFNEKYPFEFSKRPSKSMLGFWKNIDFSKVKKRTYGNYTLYLFDQDSFIDKNKMHLDYITEQFGILLNENNDIWSPYFNTQVFHAQINELINQGTPHFFDYESITFYHSTIKQYTTNIVVAVTSVILGLLFFALGIVINKIDLSIILVFVITGTLTAWFKATDPQNRIAFVTYNEKEETIHQYRGNETTVFLKN